MASHSRLVLEELLAVLRADLGDNDLSTVGGTPRVVIADGGHPPVGPPYLLLASPVGPISHDQGAPLTEYHIARDIEWWGFVAGTEDTTESRAFAALDFGDEIVQAIQDAHADPGNTTLHTLTVLLCSWDQVFGDEPGLPPGMAMVHGVIHYETDLPRGG